MTLVEFEYDDQIIAKAELHVLPRYEQQVSIFGKSYIVLDVYQELEITKDDNNITVVRERNVCTIIDDR